MQWTFAWLFFLAVPAAHAEPWLCTNAYGNKEFSYEPESAMKKNCVHHPIPSTNTVRIRPRGASGEQPYLADFPKVDRKTQKQRDAARRAILERELAEEKKLLAAAIDELAEQKRARSREKNRARVEQSLKPYENRVKLHLTNIANLEKELGHEG